MGTNSLPFPIAVFSVAITERVFMGSRRAFNLFSRLRQEAKTFGTMQPIVLPGPPQRQAGSWDPFLQGWWQRGQLGQGLHPSPCAVPWGPPPICRAAFKGEHETRLIITFKICSKTVLGKSSGTRNSL